MKNLVKIHNNETASIICHRRDGSTVDVQVSISDLSKVNKIEGTWSVSSTSADGSRPYAMSYLDGKRIYLHRMILDFPNGLEVDHISGDTLCNTRDNIRAVTAKVNQEKKIISNKPYSTNTSGYRGISQQPNGKWSLTLRRHRIGTFENLESAVLTGEQLRLAINHARLSTSNN